MAGWRDDKNIKIKMYIVNLYYKEATTKVLVEYTIHQSPGLVKVGSGLLSVRLRVVLMMIFFLYKAKKVVFCIKTHMILFVFVSDG